MTTIRSSWADYDQPRLLTGNVHSGIGVEIDRRMAGLLAETEHNRLHSTEIAPARGVRSLGSIRRRVGLVLVHLGTAVQGPKTQPRHHAGARIR